VKKKQQMFEELLASVREAGAILRGERKPSRRTVKRGADSDRQRAPRHARRTRSL